MCCTRFHGAAFHGAAWLLVLLALSFMGTNASAGPPKARGLEAVGHEQVELRGGFWGPRLKTNHEVTVPHALNCLDRGGHITNFDKAAGKFEGPLKGHHAFDSDLHKALEGALYSLQHFDDPKLLQRVDEILDRILAAQQDDGYLVSYFIVKEQDQKWQNMRLRHQLYNAGHFFEMAVEHHRLTGDRKVLDAAKRFADHIDDTFGPGKRYEVGGHEEVELALVKLYRATGERRYLELSRFFLDERGHAHGTERKPFDYTKIVPPKPPKGPLTGKQRRAARLARLKMRKGRMQDHKPLTEQHEAVGHAVRAGYIYSAMADIARLTDAPAYEKALDHLWRDVVSRKMYVSGGIGTAQYHDEGFGDPYLLPNQSGYCESCAAIAHVLWQHRMNLLKGEAKYADVMELALYNAAISGIAISGDAFFYQNPLAHKGKRKRSSWIGLACCPTNLTRITPQVGGFAYARDKGRVYVNLYAAGEASIKMDYGTTVKLRQTTNYPWDGRVRLTVDPQRATEFTLCLRIPGWAQGKPVPSDLYRFAEAKVPPVTLKVNGRSVDATPQDDGYVHLKRRWSISDGPLHQGGDTVELNLPMPVHRVYAHEKVEDNRGKVALMRGPIVYCLEATDHGEADLFKLSLPRDAKLSAEHRPDLLGGVTLIRATGRDDQQRDVDLTAVPYYSWQNREPGAMTVWVNEQ